MTGHTYDPVLYFDEPPVFELVFVKFTGSNKNHYICEIWLWDP